MFIALTFFVLMIINQLIDFMLSEEKQSDEFGTLIKERTILCFIPQGVRLTLPHSPQVTWIFCGTLEVALLVAHGATGYYSTY